MSLHLSKQQARDRALQLATDFMRTQDTKGWDWACLGAGPHASDPQRRGRKIPTRWTVVIQYSRHGAITDGPALLNVNIETGAVEWWESA